MAGSRHEAGKDRMVELNTTMSDEDQYRPLIRNEDTLLRRAWIDRALAGVRERLQPDEFTEKAAVAGTAGNPDVASPVRPEGPPAETGNRPRLYVVRNKSSR